MLATLTPTEYVAVPRRARNASGFQSAPVPGRRVRARQQERQDDQGLRGGPRRPRLLLDGCSRPEPLRRVPALPRPRRYPVPAAMLERDVTKADVFTPELVPVFAAIYARRATSTGPAYETCEELVDLEDNFQLWRFRHLKTVERIIGIKTGTGGSSGATSCSGRSSSPSFPSCTPCAHNCDAART